MRQMLALLLCAAGVLCSGGAQSQGGNLAGNCSAGAGGILGSSMLQRSPPKEPSKVGALEEGASLSEPEGEPEPEPEPEQERTKRGEDARFLMQSTFGPTTELLEELKTVSYADWIQQQLQLPVESHREYYRRRVNPPWDSRVEEKVLRAAPCHQGRFRSFAFAFTDVGKSLSVNGSAILVAGKLRTEVRPHPLASTWLGMTGFMGTICHVTEELGADVAVVKQGGDCRRGRQTLPNPSIFLTGQIPELQSPTEEVKPGVLVLADVQGACGLQAPSNGSQLFVQVGGKHHLYDERLQLLGNTPEQPSRQEGVCAPRNHINELSCSMPEIAEGSLAPGLMAEVLQLAKGKYPSQVSDSALLASVVDETIDGFSGFPSLPDVFAVRWTGSLSIKQAGEYVFYLTSDDGSQLKVNGTRLVDNGGYHGMRERSGKVTLPAGSHDIEVEYFQGGGGRGIKFQWKGPDSMEVKGVVPSTALSTSGKAFQAGVCPISCGSPGEVASEPALGHHMPLRTSGDRRGLLDDEFDSRYTDRMHSSLAKSTVWTMKVLQGRDQLRQRTAWALSQIFVVSTQGIGGDDLSEQWMTFYDLMLRNAFGSFKDILREVTFSPLMGRYLTHTGSSSYDYNRNMPNENYGREIMQLFTIGLNLLNPDGTEQKDAQGASIPTYTNEHILNFARVLTGFLEQGARDNTEWRDGRSNLIDPMRISPSRHDIYPKPDLTSGYIGDGYPSCSETLPQGAFLKKGSRYEFSGLNHKEGAGLSLPAASQLGQALCGPELKCSRVVVVLEADVACSGDECSASSVGLVKVGSHWYRHVPPACVHNFFAEPTAQEADGPERPAEAGYCVVAEDGKHWGSIKLDSEDGNSEERQAACLAKCRAANGTGCELIWSQWNKGCYVLHWTKAFSGNGRSRHYCWNFEKKGLKGRSYMLAKKGQLSCPAGAEVHDIKECEQAAVSLGLVLTARPHVNSRTWHRYPHGCSYGNGRVYFSANGTEYVPSGSLPPLCRAFVTLGDDGALVMSNGHTRFTVPDMDSPPGAGLHIATTETRTLFSKVPTDKAQALAALKMGAHAPAGACSVCQGPVKAYGSSGQDLNAESVLEVDGQFFKNVESRVRLEQGQSFRNPPVFLKSVQEPFAEKQVLAEVEALLDHLFRHQNTPVFIGRRLIQRFVSSNPSPGYVAAVSAAFSTGSYEGVTYSGKYGDLAATVAAVLLHPEARVLATNQRTSARGALREPMMKFIHLMRSMRYQDEAKEQVVFQQLQDVVGQFPYQAPSVFNYYLADYDLPMVSAEPEPEPEEPEPEPESEEPEPEPEPEPENLFGPEFQIFTPPYLVGYLNGMQAMIQSGVDSRCTGGKDLGISVSLPEDGTWRQVCPQGSLRWEGAGSPNRTVEELNVLLTGGRLTPVAKEVVKQAYENAAEGEKIEAAQKAMVMTAEFNTLGAPLPLPGTRPPLANDDGGARASYKAVVFLFMAGGADTWNMLVPQDCDLYEEYRIIRTDLTMEPGELSKVQTAGQKCSTFGVHASFNFVKQLYDKQQAAFVTNVGNLVEPMTMQSFRSGAAQKCFNLFSHSDQQNGAMTLKCQQMGTTAHGTGGRIADALAAGSQGLRTESFSLAGSSVWSKGAVTRREIVDDHGSKTFKGYEEWIDSIANLTSQRHGNVYAEAYSEAFLRGMETSQSLGRTLQEAKTVTNYNTNGGLRRQLHQVAKLISAREGRKAERDFFFVSVGGWDMHSNLKAGLQNGFGVVDDALQGFVQEMEAQNVWQDVVVMTSSEFARTLDSNGGGSDHAWAGQQIILSGSLRGGRVFNSFPASLLPGSARDLGRGRLIPEYPWESMLVPVADWLGVTPDQHAVTFPNLAHFNASHIIPTNNLFK